ncbi:I78 family peptidase inhibitor [Microvirga yunnanensis]
MISDPAGEAAVQALILQATRHKAQALLTANLLIIVPASGFAQPATGPAEKGCSAGEAQSLVGQPYSPELAERARRAAGAREIRKIEPGGAYTTDLDSNRLNVEVDRAGIVMGLRCGRTSPLPLPAVRLVGIRTRCAARRQEGDGASPSQCWNRGSHWPRVMRGRS